MCMHRGTVNPVLHTVFRIALPILTVWTWTNNSLCLNDTPGDECQPQRKTAFQLQPVNQGLRISLRLNVWIRHCPRLTSSLARQRSKAVDQMPCQAKCCVLISSSQWQSYHQVCQQEIHITLTSSCLSVRLEYCVSLESPFHELCCIWHSCFFNLFPLANILPFFFLLLIELAYPALQFLHRALVG